MFIFVFRAPSDNSAFFFIHLIIVPVIAFLICVVTELSSHFYESLSL